MENGLADKKIEQRGIVRLYDEKEYFLRRNAEKSRSNYGIAGVGPYSRVYEV